MADSGMTHTESVQNYPYLPRMEGGLVKVSRPGACDPDMRQLLARLVPWRFATLAFRFTNVAGNLLLAKQQLQFFDKGAGEAGTGGFAGVVTQSETNAVEQGGLVPSGTRWYTVGGSVAMQAAYSVAAGADAAGDRLYEANLSGALGYAQRCARVLADCTYVELNHGTGNACRYSMGPLGLWLNSVGDGSEAYSSQGGVPGQFFWMSTPDESTGKNEDGALRGTCDVTHNATVEQNGANPTTGQRDVILPVKIVLMGFPLCEPGVISGDPGMLDQLIDRMAQRGLLPSGK